MHVAQVTIGRFRHLEDVNIGALEPPRTSEVVVLAGPNGGGKSSVLELLAWSLTNSWGFQWQTARTFPGSSFEVAFGLSESDLTFMEGRVDAEPALDPSKVLPRLRASRRYYRSFDYPAGAYAGDPDFNNQAHNLVANVLRDRMKALFLRSSRLYPRRNYDRNRVFDYRTRMSSEYLRTMAFVLTESQYIDQMDFLVEQAYTYPRSVGLHTLATEENRTSDPRPTNPLAPYDELFQRLFPTYRLARQTEELRDQLYVTLPNGQEVPFSDLSSGEQEVFFLLTFFLRHDVRESMVFIDEPELHLHPELVRRMVRLMLAIRPGNQLWLATHNAEVVDEAGRDRTFYVVRDSQTGAGRAMRASDEEGAIELMRTMFGFSGYVGMARKVVLLEGDDASADRHTFAQMFPAVADEIRFEPINSADNLLRINRVALSILGQTVGHAELYLVRDRDYLDDDQVAGYVASSGGRLFVLRRHEIENYLLNADALAEVVEQLLGASPGAAAMESLMADAARMLAGKVVKGLVTARLSRIFAPRDCSIGGFEDSREWIDGNGAWESTILDPARLRFVERVTANLLETQTAAGPATVAAAFDAAADEVRAAVTSGYWRVLFPGKELLQSVGRSLLLPKGPVLANSLIRNLAANPERIDRELVEIIEAIAGRSITD